MRDAPETVMPAVVGGPDEDAAWVGLGVHAKDVGVLEGRWVRPFDAALAEGDWFTPTAVGPCHRQDPP